MKSTQPCIALDVSKGSSHVCAYESKDRLIQAPIQILHDREGFKVLDELVQTLSSDNESPPMFIYETTGIYHRPLKRYLSEKNYNQIEVSPLLAAKHRKNSGIRVPKSDKADPKSLARLFYDVNLSVKHKVDDIYYDLLQYDRYYQGLTRLLVECKVHFKEKLDILFPRFDTLFTDIYTPYTLELLVQYPHPELILHKRSDALENELVKNGLQRNKSLKVIQKLKTYCQNCVPGSSPKSVDTGILKSYIREIQHYKSKRNEVIQSMITIAQEIPLYSYLQSIPGIGPILSIRLISELGDLSRFENTRQLVAYAGLDPVVYQSGQYEGKHLSISKKGNKYLRCILFQVIGLSICVKHDHSLKTYVQKKKQTHANKSAKIAGCAKLLRIIFSMYQSNEPYHF